MRGGREFSLLRGTEVVTRPRPRSRNCCRKRASAEIRRILRYPRARLFFVIHFRRLVPEEEAPVNVHYAKSRRAFRSALLRVRVVNKFYERDSDFARGSEFFPRELSTFSLAIFPRRAKYLSNCEIKYSRPRNIPSRHGANAVRTIRRAGRNANCNTREMRFARECRWRREYVHVDYTLIIYTHLSYPENCSHAISRARARTGVAALRRFVRKRRASITLLCRYTRRARVSQLPCRKFSLPPVIVDRV